MSKSQSPTALQDYQRCIRQWSGHLTLSEFAVVMQLIDRTAGWRKACVTISVSKMIEGDSVYTGVSLGKTAFFAALKGLEDKGAITRHKDPKGRQIRQYSVNMAWSPAMLTSPNHLQTSSPNELHKFAKRTTPVRETNTGECSIGESRLENEDLGPEQPAAIPASSDPEEVIRKAMSDVKSRRRAAPAKAKTLPQQMRQAEAAWRDAVEETHPTGGMLAWSTKERVMVKAKMKGWNSDRATFGEFLAWCATNWAVVCRKHLGWMTKSPPPKTPEVGFLMGFIDRFHEAFADADLTKWMNAAQTAKYDKLIAKGMTHDEAVHRMAKQDAVEETRDEVRKGKEEIRIRRGMLDKREARIEARSRPAQVHPKSKAAKRIREDQKTMSQAELDAINLNDVPPLDPNWEPEP